MREVGFVQNNVDIASISATMEPVEVSLESIPSSSRPVSLSPTKKVRNWIGKIPERFSPKKSPRKQGIITKPTEAQSKNDEPQETAPFSPVAAGVQKHDELQETAPFSPATASVQKQLSIARLAVEFDELVDKTLPSCYRDKSWSLDTPIPYKQVDAEDVKPRHVLAVTKSWSKLTSQPDWQKKAGVTMLRKMFELDPGLSKQYGFGKDWHTPSGYMNPRFEAKAVVLIAMIDKVIVSLGPDLEPMEVELQSLGRRHVLMEAQPENWVSMGSALFHTLELALGKEFTPSDKSSWSVVYNFLAYNMIIGLVAELAERSE